MDWDTDTPIASGTASNNSNQGDMIEPHTTNLIAMRRTDLHEFSLNSV
jgi:hypothetical protein